MSASIEDIKGMLKQKPNLSPREVSQARDEKHLGTYVCDFCGKSFTQNRFLGAHKLSHQTGTCEFCNKEMSRVSVGTHQIWCHKNPNRRLNKKQAAELEQKQEQKRAAWRAQKQASRKIIKESKMTADNFVPVNSGSNVVSDNDIDAILSLLFPDGNIPVTKLDAAIEWVKMTKALIS